MNCAEFQKILPGYIESGGTDPEQTHLQSCGVCSDLVQDLQYIAEAAKLLLPMQDPSPRVWQGIQTSLEKQGIVRPPRGPARLEPFLVPGRTNWMWRTVGITVLAVLGVVSLLRYNAEKHTPSSQAPAMSSTSSNVDSDDQQLLAEVSASNPAMRGTYEKSLRSINSYIADAKKSVQANPSDEDAREQLMQAYEQRAALYEMAMSRAGQ